jgi:hypothetical protein
MWSLIIFSAVVNASPGGGASHFVTTVSFAEEAQCTAAKSRLSVGSAVPEVIPGHSNVLFILRGICVQVK